MVSYLLGVPKFFYAHLSSGGTLDLFKQCLMLFYEQPLMHVYRAHVHLKTFLPLLQRGDTRRLYIIYLIEEIKYLGDEDTTGPAAGLSRIHISLASVFHWCTDQLHVWALIRQTSLWQFYQGLIFNVSYLSWMIEACASWRHSIIGLCRSLVAPGRQWSSTFLVVPSGSTSDK